MTTALPSERPGDEPLMSIAATAVEAETYLAELIENNPAALAELRRLLLEGLESIEEATEEADDDWLQSLVEGIRQRAAARTAGRP